MVVVTFPFKTYFIRYVSSIDFFKSIHHKISLYIISDTKINEESNSRIYERALGEQNWNRKKEIMKKRAKLIKVITNKKKQKTGSLGKVTK